MMDVTCMLHEGADHYAIVIRSICAITLLAHLPGTLLLSFAPGPLLPSQAYKAHLGEIPIRPRRVAVQRLVALVARHHRFQLQLLCGIPASAMRPRSMHTRHVRDCAGGYTCVMHNK